MIKGFFVEQNITFEQVQVLTHALVALARVDGVHDNEMALVRDFYGSCARAGDPRLEDVVKGPFEPARAKACFDSPELAQLFVKSLVLLAFADGQYAKEEDTLIREYAAEVGVDGEGVDRLLESTKDFLIGSLAHLRNAEALTGVMAKLARPS